jgi:heme-degrading monooxygenase HmoA
MIEPKQQETVTVTDQPEAINQAPEDAPEAVKQRPYGTRNPNALIEQRQQRLYKRQLEGLTARQLVLDHADREGVSVATAWRDWEAVNKWNAEDWSRDRENMLARLQTMRAKLFNAAIRKGQLQTAAQVLDSLGKVVNESGVESQAAATPTLNITVETQQTRETQ